MAYCRFNKESDVYMFELSNMIVCCECSLITNEPNRFSRRSDAIKHLNIHKTLGYKVSQEAVDKLLYEFRLFGNEV